MPQQPSPAPKKRHGCLYSLLGAVGVIVVIIIIGAVASSGGNGTTPSENAAAPASSAPAQQAAQPSHTAKSTPAAPAYVTFSVSGPAKDANITYGSDSDNIQVNGTMGTLGDSAPLPWNAKLRLHNVQYYTLIATLEDGGSATCSITVGSQTFHAYASGTDSICDVQIGQDDPFNPGKWEKE